MKMKESRLALAVLLALPAHGFAQLRSARVDAQPLVLTGAIPLSDVQGRVDHLGVDSRGRLFVSAFGNNSEEVLDLAAGIRAHSIRGIPRPQGVAFSPEANKLFVGSDEGKLYIYDGTSLDLIASLEFGDDVDNLRYDAPSLRVYVGYGDDPAGAIAVVDAATNQRLPEEFKLGAHPESFQLEKSGPNIYVNLPDLKQIAVISRNTGKISRWTLTLESNFPMALDEANHRLFVVTHAPALGGARYRLRPYDRRAAVRAELRRCFLRCRPPAHLCSGRRGLYQRVPPERRGPLRAAGKGPIPGGCPHGWIFWKRTEGV